MLDWSLCHYVTSFLSFVSLCFKVYLVWYEYCYPSFHFHLHEIPLTIPSFSVCVFTSEVSCGWHIYGSHFLFFFFFVFIHSATLCLLIGVFSPFTFKVIIDKYILIAISLIVWGYFVVLAFFLLLLFSSLVIWWLFLVLCLDYFHYVSIYHRYLVCGYHEDYILQPIYIHDYFKLMIS